MLHIFVYDLRFDQPFQFDVPLFYLKLENAVVNALQGVLEPTAHEVSKLVCYSPQIVQRLDVIKYNAILDELRLLHAQQCLALVDLQSGVVEFFHCKAKVI